MNRLGYRRRFARRAFIASASLISIATASPAFAQTDPAPAAQAAEQDEQEVVVTAQFREQRLQDTPLSITAITADLLRERSQDDLEAVARQAPSVTLNEMGGAYGQSMGASIRGIGQFDFNPAYEPGVGLYIDDVYYPTLTGANFDLLDLERVEILRGPQGTLTGRNSIGGAIRIISRRPSNENTLFGEAGYGSRNRIDLRVGANFVLAENLYARISGVHKEQDGYVDQIDYGCANPGNAQGIAATIGVRDNCVVDVLGSTNYSGVRGALRWQPSTSVDLMVVADYMNSDRTSSGEVVTETVPAAADFICGRFCTYANWFLPTAGQRTAWNSGNRNRFTGWGVSFHADVDLSEQVQLQSITAYREYNNRWGTDDDFTPDPSRGAGGYNDLDFWFFSQEVRLNARIGDHVDFTVGGFYSDQRSTYYTEQDIRYIVPGLPLQFVGNDPINADSWALFGTVIIRPVENFTITGGLRYTNEHKDYTFRRRNLDYSTPLTPDPFGLGPLEGLVAVYDGDRIDWRVSVDYRWSPQVLTYVTVGTGFKGGGVTARPFLPQHALQGSFNPEIVTAYEAGIKTDLFDRRVRFNVSGFYNDYTDIQLPLSDCSAYGGGPCAVVANAGDGKIWGIEAELFARPVEGLQIDGSLSWLDGEYTRISPAVSAGLQIQDPIVTPRWQWSFGIQYQIDLGTAGSLTPRFDVSNTGRQGRGRGPIAPGQFLYYDAYTLANARLTWRNPSDDLSISFEVRNLFDEYYIPFSFDAVYGFSGTAYNQVGEPREWAITIRKEF